MSRDPLVDALGDLAAAIEFPAPPDVRAAVRERLERAPAPARWRRLAFALTAAVVVASGFLIASPDARRAVADFLGVPGVRVEVREHGPTPGPTVEDDLHGVFGRRVSPAAAAAAVDFPLPAPAAAPGAPDVYLLDDAGAVTLAYGASPDLPEIEDSGYGLIVVALADFPPDRYFGKLLVGPNPIVDEVEVGGRPGYWTKAPEHTLSFDGRLRASGNALLWETADGVTIRVETAAGLARTRAVAESIP